MASNMYGGSQMTGPGDLINDIDTPVVPSMNEDPVEPITESKEEPEPASDTIVSQDSDGKDYFDDDEDVDGDSVFEGDGFYPDGNLEDDDSDGDGDEGDEDSSECDDEDLGNGESGGICSFEDFVEENKALLKKVENVLKFMYPSKNVSLAELLASGEGYISMVESVGEASENEIAAGILKIYNSDLNEFLKHFNQNEKYSLSQEPDPETEKYNNEIFQLEKIRVENLNKILEYCLRNLPQEKQKDENAIISVLAAYCQKQDNEAIYDYISFLIKKFYNMWLLPDGSGDRFPYVINSGTKDVGPRSAKGYSNVIVQKEWDGAAKKIVTDCQELHDQKPESIRFILDGQSYKSIDGDEKLLKKKGVDWFVEENGTYKKTFDFQQIKSKTYDSDGCHGKGCVALNQLIAQELKKRFDILDTIVDSTVKKKGKVIEVTRKDNLISFFSSSNRFRKSFENKGYRFKDYLHDLGIGVDCSGYVSRALEYVMSELNIPASEQTKTVGCGHGWLKSNAIDLNDPKDVFVQREKAKDFIAEINVPINNLSSKIKELQLENEIIKNIDVLLKKYDKKNVDSLLEKLNQLKNRDAVLAEINNEVKNFNDLRKADEFDENAKKASDALSEYLKNNDVLNKSLYDVACFNTLIEKSASYTETEMTNKLTDVKTFLAQNSTYISKLKKVEKEILKKIKKVKTCVIDSTFTEIMDKVLPGDMEMIGSTGNGFHIKIVYAVDKLNSLFIDHQSTSFSENERYGVKETKMKSGENKEELLAYRFVRPKFLKDAKLKEYFINMLKEKGRCP